MMSEKLLDFLYHDARRVGSLLSQLSEAGLLTEVRESSASEKSAEVSLEGKAEGRIPIVAKASAGGGVSGRYSRTGELEKTFDPLWQNARKFVDYASDAASEIQSARIGQIVELSGTVTVIDFEFLKNFMANQSIMDSLMSGSSDEEGNRQQRRANKKRPSNNKGDPPIADLFGLFPYKIQMTIDGPTKAWATMSEEFLVTEPSDLVLKYGRALDGEWKVIGILDASPSFFDGQLIGQMDLDDGFEGFGMKITNAMAPMARTLLGRPSDAFGITPLIVYREIA